MGLTGKQKRFAHEFVVDHNGRQAAIRAGYAENSAKVKAAQLKAKPEVRQLIEKLDTAKLEELGIDQSEAIADLRSLLVEARQLQPKVWKGEPVTYLDPETDEWVVVTKFRSAQAAARLAELQVKLSGLLEAKSSVEHFEEVVYTLHLDRDLEAESEQ